MSIDLDDIDDGARRSASQLLARAAAAMARADRILDQSIADFFLTDAARLDDRIRAMLERTLTAIVAVIESDLRRQAARSVPALGAGAAVIERLADTRALRDRDLMRELIGRTRQDVLADTLPIAAPDDAGGGSLLARLTASADSQVAKAALALMAAAGRRREFMDGGRLAHSELPAELHHRLVWAVAAALREQAPGAEGDRALADAALRSLTHHDESDSVESAATRLATAIDPQPGERAVLLTHALGERQVALFVALLAHALRTDFAAARGLVLSGGDPLWLALRAIDLDRASIARIGLALSHDVEAFADTLDAVMAVTPDEGRAAIGTLTLSADFRAAIAGLDQR